MSYTKNRNYIAFVGLTLCWLAAVCIMSGCKKKSSKPADVNNPQNKTKQPDVQGPDQPVPQKKTESEKETPQNQSENKLYLEQVIQSAHFWGPVKREWYGKTAPEFTLNDLKGNKHSLSNYRGKNVMLVLWATWCGPCKLEMPHLKKLRRKYEENQLAILAVSNENKMLLQRFAKQNNINYTVLHQTGNMPRAYNVRGIPSSFFINGNGKIKIATSGLLRFEDMKNLVEAVWKNKL